MPKPNRVVKVHTPDGHTVDVTLVTFSHKEFNEFVAMAPSPLKEQMLMAGLIPLMMRIPMNERVFVKYKVETPYLMIYRDADGSGSAEAVLNNLEREEKHGEPQDWIIHNDKRMFSMN